MIAAAILIAAASACGGGDDDSADTTTTAATTTVAEATTTTSTTTTTTIPLVTEGATVVVANASGVSGSAGRMTDQFGEAGFTTGTPTNALEKAEDSVVHHTTADGALEVAESVALLLGGVAIETMPTPVPTAEGEIDGEVLVLLGDNQADKSFEELTGTTSSDAGGAETAAGPFTTSGSVVVVANASGVGGSAGRMADELEAAGFDVAEPTNAVVSLTESIVHYTDDPDAEEDAELLAAALGGVEVEPMPDEIPTETSELDGQVLLLLGTAQVDQALVDPDG